jgi:hypothetical protein
MALTSEAICQNNTKGTSTAPRISSAARELHNTTEKAILDLQFFSSSYMENGIYRTAIPILIL